MHGCTSRNEFQIYRSDSLPHLFHDLACLGSILLCIDFSDTEVLLTQHGTGSFNSMCLSNLCSKGVSQLVWKPVRNLGTLSCKTHSPVVLLGAVGVLETIAELVLRT